METRAKDYSNRNLQNISFINEDLSHARFIESDLRGVNFTGADLSGASFINVRTGIAPLKLFLIFISTLLISVLSGYISMLAGNTIQTMLASEDGKVRVIAIATMIIIVLFIGFTYWKGTTTAIRQLMIPVFIFSIIVGGISYFSGIGTGKGLVYELVALVLVIVMLVVGTIARATIGSISNILFVIVALSGGLFAKSVGGGVGTLIMAISCALISKRALSGAKGFDLIRKLAGYFTTKFGTSFRNCRLREADFSLLKKINNADFSNADITVASWGDCRKINCIV
jgi:hypothetical protein